jgi:hypothetical protein
MRHVRLAAEAEHQIPGLAHGHITLGIPLTGVGVQVHAAVRLDDDRLLGDEYVCEVAIE